MKYTIDVKYRCHKQNACAVAFENLTSGLTRREAVEQWASLQNDDAVSVQVYVYRGNADVVFGDKCVMMATNFHTEELVRQHGAAGQKAPHVGAGKGESHEKDNRWSAV